MPSFSTSISRTKSSALSSASARSKGSTSVPSRPSAAASAAFSGAGVSRKSGRPEKKARGCGSKVSMMQGDAEMLGLGARRREHRLVAAMHAVEIADRHDAAAPGVGQVVERGDAVRLLGRSSCDRRRVPGERRECRRPRVRPSAFSRAATRSPSGSACGPKSAAWMPPVTKSTGMPLSTAPRMSVGSPSPTARMRLPPSSATCALRRGVDRRVRLADQDRLAAELAHRGGRARRRNR